MRKLDGTVKALLCASLLSVQATAWAQPDTLSHDGILRDFLVHLPPVYDGIQQLPVVVAFHGGFGSSENLQQQSGLSDVADDEGFIVVYPNGTGTIPTWNGGECCGYAARENIDDVGFVDRVLDRVIETYHADPTRVYATGISNGGAMTYRLACELADRFAAFAPVAATYRNPDCNPARTVPLIHFHSERDDNVPIQGGVGNGPSNLDWLPLDSTLAHFASYNHCLSSSTVQASDSLRVTTWDGCEGDAEIRLYLTSDGGHSWPGGTKTIIGDSVSTAVDASRTMWEFFTHYESYTVDQEVPLLPVRSGLLAAAFPNPFDDAVSVEAETSGSPTRLRLAVFDLLGRRVLAQELRSGTDRQTIRTDAWSAGTYLFRFTTLDGRLSRSLIRVKVAYSTTPTGTN